MGVLVTRLEPVKEEGLKAETEAVMVVRARMENFMIDLFLGRPRNGFVCS